MKLFIIGVFYFSTCVMFAQSTNTEWVAHVGGPFSDQGASVTHDLSGNVYSTGHFYDTVDFNPGLGEENLISGYSSDLFIQKLDPSGGLLWAVNMGGTGSNYGKQIVVDNEGNSYVVGEFTGHTDFDPGIGEANFNAGVNTNGFVLKLNSSGELIWAKHLAGAGLIQRTSLALGADNSVYIAGDFKGTIDFDPGIDTHELTVVGEFGNDDAFIEKLSPDGDFVWVKQIGDWSIDGGNSIHIDESDNVLVTGSFSDTVDFDPGIGVFEMSATTGNSTFILKLENTGDFIWAKQVGGRGNKIESDNLGNIFVCVSYSETVDTDPGVGEVYLTSEGYFDTYLLKLNSSGNFIWSKSIGGEGIDLISSLIIDEYGNVYVTGHFQFDCLFNLESGVVTLSTASSFSDIFLAKFDELGNMIWVQQMGGERSDYALSIDLDNAGNLLIAGDFSSSLIDFDPGAGSLEYSTNGQRDIFVLKISNWSLGLMESSSAFSSLTVYPNPSGNYFTVDCENVHKMNYSIYSSLGHVVSSGVINSDYDKVDVSELSNGIYFVRFFDDKNNSIVQFVKN